MVLPIPIVGITRVLLQNGYKPNGLKNHSLFPKLVLHNSNYSFCTSFSLSSNGIVSNCGCKSQRKLYPVVWNKFVVLFLSRYLNRIPALVKYNSVNIVKNCVAQFEFVVAYRIRRGQQIFSLYTKLWDEFALKQFMTTIRRQFMKKGKEFLLSVCAVSVFCWDTERISEDELLKHTNELDICHKLKCALENSGNGNLLACESSNCCQNSSDSESQLWHPFVNDGELIVWKKEESSHEGSGLYCYKMFGRYDDVTANDFFSAFLDTVTRKDWDSHVVSLYVVESEPATNSDVIYWETKWPTLFSNRDYVFKRRYKIDERRKLMTIVNKSTEHPSVPVYNNKTRVHEYWSFMVIRPLDGDFTKPGIEFSLTYFDNPGLTLPSTLTHWVSATGMPEYLRRLRLAALAIAKDVSGEGYDVADEKVEGGDPPAPTPDPLQPTPPPPPPSDQLSPLAVFAHWAASYLL